MNFSKRTATNEVFFEVFPTHTFAGSVEAKECQECHTMHHFYVNRRGETKCVGCDDGE